MSSRTAKERIQDMLNAIDSIQNRNNLPPLVDPLQQLKATF